MGRLATPEPGIREAKARSVVARGEVASPHVAILCGGFAIKYVQVPNGRRQILSYRRPGQFLLGAASLATRTRYMAQALTDVRLSLVRRDELMSAVKTDPAVCDGLFDVLEKEEQEITDLVVDLGRRDALQRVCHLLLKLIEWNNAPVENNKTAFPITLRQEHVADFLGLTVAHVNRTIATLRADKVLESVANVLKINDVQHLRAQLL